MTLLTFFGCGLTAYGPALSIFFLHVAKDAQLVLLMVSSAFFWLISILLSSIIWYLIKPIYPKNELTILYSVILQEIFRWLLFNIMMRAEPGLILVANNPKSLYNRSSFAFVCGMGFGLMSGVVTYFTLLVNSIGPAVLMCNSCTALTVYIVGAFTTYTT
ncbi:gamma-secretase subunit Aph-1 [Gigaspora margarita]|nr:gamma-secretase subunit Aph-1 [Gigaspora margarita]